MRRETSCPNPRRTLRLPGSGPGCMKIAQTGDPMTWTKPAFDEIKMDAEAKSYSGEGDNFEE